MKIVIVDNSDRQNISLHFGREILLSFNTTEMSVKYTDLFFVGLKFELFFAEKHSKKFNFFRKCEVVKTQINCIYFIYDNIVDGLEEKDILPIIRKEKLILINEKT